MDGAALFIPRFLDHLLTLTAAAEGHFIHVNVDRETRRPVPIPSDTRAVLERLAANSD